MDWEALKLSLLLGALTVAILLPLALIGGRWLAITRSRGRVLIEAVLTLPLVLPPTVIGFYLLVGMGPASPVGEAWTALFGDALVFSSGDVGFEGWSGAKKALDRRIADLGTPLPTWGLHDLRRTFSTMAHERGLAEPHIIEAVLAHEGAQSGVAGVYNRAAYREQKRAALNAWAGMVVEVTEKPILYQ